MNAQIPLSELVTHAGWLRRLATGLLRDPDAAEDVVQATLVAAWRNPPSADRDVRPWLAEVARNQAHDQRRGDGRRRTREAVGQELAEGAGSGAVSPESLIGDLEIHRQVAEVVTGLDEPYRSTVVLHYYEGLDTPAVAARLGVAAGTIRWRLKEGLDRIRVELDRRHGGDRKRWQLALLPLVPLSALEKAVPAGAATAKGAASGTRVALWVSGGLVAAMLVVMASRGGGRQPDDSARTAVARPTGERDRPAFREAARVPKFAAPVAAVPTAVDSEAAARVFAEQVMRGMLAAIIDDAYESFIAHGGDVFTARITRETVTSLNKALGKRLAGGYEPESLGSLRKTIDPDVGEHIAGPYVVHLWKIAFRDGGDDVLVSLSVKDGQVLGVFLKSGF